MRPAFILIIISFTGTRLMAQIPEDALKFSWGGPGGTARNQAIGGANGSLGGDISSIYGNPAGLGFYKTNEMVLTPGLSFLSTKGNFRGTSNSDKSNNFNLGTSGVVWGMAGTGGRSVSSAFSLAVTRTANFNSNINYKGQNDFSSYGEQFASEVSSSGLSLQDVLNSNTVSLQTRMAVYTYLVDTLTIPGNTGKDAISMAFWDKLKNGGKFLVNQQNRIQTTGGATEIALGFASNLNNRVYIGGSLGIPIVNYNKTSSFIETDATGNNDNNFASSQLDETLQTKGVGLNLKLGLIFKPAESVRIGLALHSPTFYALTDTYNGSMTTNTENYPPSPGIVSVSSDMLNGGGSVQYKYDLVTPWKVMVSGSYVLHEVEDVRLQRGFISGDIEYVNYTSNNYKSSDQGSDNSYYAGVNRAIKDYYKSALNFRLGGELKFNTVMARLGFSYYGNPYNDSELKAQKTFVSGGLGYRNKGMFIDLTYVLAMNKDVNFPYRLSDKANTFAELQGTGSNILVSFGFKF